MARKKREMPTEPEWSHMVEADKIGTVPRKISISPTPEQLKKLAVRLGVTSLDEARGDLVLSRDSGSMVIFISGQIYARITQPSAVSGKSLKTEITDTVEAWYADPEQAVSFAKARQERLVREGGSETPVLDESEDPEPVIDGKIDVGELVTQYLSLSINPYVRAEDEVFEIGDEEKPGQKKTDELYENPFAALKNWKNNTEKGE